MSKIRKKISGLKTQLTSAWHRVDRRGVLSRYASNYANGVSTQVHVESHLYSKKLAKRRVFLVPAVKGKRSSFGLDRSLIPEARIGWQVKFYFRKHPKKRWVRLVASGKVRKFLHRSDTGRPDLVIVRLEKELDIKKLMKKRKITVVTLECPDLPADEELEYVAVPLEVEAVNPRLYDRCLMMPKLVRYMQSLKVSSATIRLLLEDLKEPMEVRDAPEMVEEIRLPDYFKPFQLNEEQQICLLKAISNQITVINGVVGSGKSHLAACIAYYLAFAYKQKILVCSAFPGSVKLISEVLINRQKDVYLRERVLIVKIDDFHRQNAKNYENERIEIMESGRLCQIVEQRIRKRLRSYVASIVGPTKDCAEDSTIDKLVQRSLLICSKYTIEEAERIAIENSQIVCCQIEQLDQERLKNYDYDVVIIDDAHLTAKVDLLMPLLNPNLKQIILLGEEKRDPMDEEEEDYVGHVDSDRLFSELIDYGLDLKLSQHYRAHDNLSRFYNKLFYDMSLKSNPICNNRFGELRAKNPFERWWTYTKNNSMFGIIAADSRIGVRTDVAWIIDDLLDKESCSSSSITIITTEQYDIQRKGHRGIRVKTVLECLGLENDFVILSCDQWSERSERLSWEFDPNFLRNPEALKIALTRARLGVFIAAEGRFIQKVLNTKAENSSLEYCEVWRQLVIDCVDYTHYNH